MRKIKHPDFFLFNQSILGRKTPFKKHKVYFSASWISFFITVILFFSMRTQFDAWYLIGNWVCNALNVISVQISIAKLNRGCSDTVAISAHCGFLFSKISWNPVTTRTFPSVFLFLLSFVLCIISFIPPLKSTLCPFVHTGPSAADALFPRIPSTG